jgi:hypothetical protein
MRRRVKDLLRDYIISGRAIDLVLAVMAAEFGWLSWRRGRPQPARVVDVACMLAPGMFLALALRVALTSRNWPLIAGLLAASMPLHIADLRIRRL